MKRQTETFTKVGMAVFGTQRPLRLKTNSYDEAFIFPKNLGTFEANSMYTMLIRLIIPWQDAEFMLPCVKN